MKKQVSKPVVLCILDGWGEREEVADNAIALARTPNWDRMVQDYPKSSLDASAGDVGLPDGQMGNSEVGHMNIGAGRIVMQDLPKIDAAIKDGSIFENPELLKFVNRLEKNGGDCHLAGLMSPGGVHSHQHHIVALARFLCDQGIPVKFHGFLDGRDTPPESAAGFLQSLLDDMKTYPFFKVSTISGRYFAMDRDNNWGRVEKAWAAIVRGEGDPASDPVAAIRQNYKSGISDEFIPPMVMEGYQGVNDGDGLLMVNFRADRAREFLASLLEPDFNHFDRGSASLITAALGMVSYSSELDKRMACLFPAVGLENIFADVIAKAGLKQLRIAETEKYAHVTFFFNAGREQPFPGEERILVPSPKVATYDLKPEMSAYELTDKLVDAIERDRFDVIIVNYANGDMVGHTGKLDAAVKAAEALDSCLGKLEKAVLDQGGVMLITADHGNCETMVDGKTHAPHTAHTVNRVPLLMVGKSEQCDSLSDGRLSDLAPTLLTLLSVPVPEEMTGKNLLVTGKNKRSAAE